MRAARTHVDEPGIRRSLDVLSDFLTLYRNPEAETMATPATFIDLSDQLTDLTPWATVQGEVAQAPTQQQILIDHAEGRCVIYLS